MHRIFCCVFFPVCNSYRSNSSNRNLYRQSPILHENHDRFLRIFHFFSHPCLLLEVHDFPTHSCVHLSVRTGQFHNSGASINILRWNVQPPCTFLVLIFEKEQKTIKINQRYGWATLWSLDWKRALPGIPTILNGWENLMCGNKSGSETGLWQRGVTRLPTVGG